VGKNADFHVVVSLVGIPVNYTAGSSERIEQVIAASAAVPNPEAPGAQGFEAALFRIVSGEERTHSGCSEG
jgi:hypothetical protein